MVRTADQDPGKVLWQARKIGYDRIIGELADGLRGWAAAGQPLARTGILDPAQVDPGQVVDVRQRSEYAAGHLPGAVNTELGDLAGHPLPTGPLVIMCGHGERAASAASVLERAGHPEVTLLLNGPDRWSAATGRSVSTA